ncbi:hypothetical protein [Pedobacter sp. L105]|uniref:hypothetical protein n=1 Tax=Pedobacter sp. L105 TaxID=1641871 RepID=UPI00131AC648|nr:hypothetical protein [Pedobacter sp. L105]
MLVLFNVHASYCQSRNFTLEAGGVGDISNFQWSIAGNLQGQSPNILSELTFKKITSLGVFFNGIYKPLKRLELNVYYQKNGIVSGQGNDADYQDDNRKFITYQEPFTSDKGQLENFRTGAGFYFISKADFSLKTAFYYVSSVQNFYILNSDFDNLNSTYKAKWRSAQLSVENSYHLTPNLSILGTISYGLLKYNSKANWNLIEIFKHPISFEQHANGYVLEGNIGLNYKLNSSLNLLLNGDIGCKKTSKGIDDSYLQNNNQIATQFNGSNINFYQLRIGTSLSF